METTHTNWLAVLVSAVAGFALGWLWYGMLFLQKWADGNGLTLDMEKGTMTKNGVELAPDFTPMIVNFVVMLVYAVLLNWFIQRLNMRTWAGGAQVGGMIGLIGLLGVFVGNMYAHNPSSLSMVDGSYTLVLFTIIGAIMGGWQKRG